MKFIHVISPILYIHIYYYMPTVLMLLTPYVLHTARQCATLHCNKYQLSGSQTD